MPVSVYASLYDLRCTNLHMYHVHMYVICNTKNWHAMDMCMQRLAMQRSIVQLQKPYECAWFLHMAVSLLLWCIKTIGSRRWFPSISWKFRWSRNGRKVDEIEHRGHQIEDFDSKIHIPRSKYSRKAEKKSKTAIKILQNFVIFWPDLMGYI